MEIEIEIELEMEMQWQNGDCFVIVRHLCDIRVCYSPSFLLPVRVKQGMI
jgi:hypothetical protein